VQLNKPFQEYCYVFSMRERMGDSPSRPYGIHNQRGKKIILQTSTARTNHSVECRHCGKEFDLLGATWRGCGVRVDRPSKMRPHCMHCICLHPDYENEGLWNNAPGNLRTARIRQVVLPLRLSLTLRNRLDKYSPHSEAASGL
jgi:hypothetical protein